ncbi:MAG: DUF2911 domain-containing protein [Calditrichia bacterium]
MATSKKFFRLFLVALVSMFVFPAGAFSQLEYPRPSPSSSVMQIVGITEVSIEYSSPGVKGRKIWGGLVPYGKVWRTGANAATEISFSTDVKINGQDFKAGTYSLFTLPGEDEWEVMFNSRTDIGGMDYKSEADVLTLKVKPETAPFRERMTFLIENNTNNSADIVLHWEKLRLLLKMEVNTDELVLEKAAQEIKDTWRPPYRAANYCLQHDLNLEKALEWINLSTAIHESYWNMRVKAQLEAKAGKKEMAIATMNRTLKLGDQMENKPFDYNRMKKLLEEWQK